MRLRRQDGRISVSGITDAPAAAPVPPILSAVEAAPAAATAPTQPERAPYGSLREILVAMDALPAATRPRDPWPVREPASPVRETPQPRPGIDPLVVVAHDRAAPFVATIAQLHRALEQARWRARRGAIRVAVIGVGADASAALVAANLAAEAALTGTRTLLVDCNIGTPVHDGLFGISRQPGLAEVLEGRTAMGSAVMPTPLASLSVVPAGFAVAGTPMLAGGRLMGALAALPFAFELVVVDAGRGDQDAVAACDGLDAAVLVAARGDAPAAQASALAHWLQSRQIMLAGTVTID